MTSNGEGQSEAKQTEAKQIEVKPTEGAQNLLDRLRKMRDHRIGLEPEIVRGELEAILERLLRDGIELVLVPALLETMGMLLKQDIEKKKWAPAKLVTNYAELEALTDSLAISARDRGVTVMVTTYVATGPEQSFWCARYYGPWANLLALDVLSQDVIKKGFREQAVKNIK